MSEKKLRAGKTESDKMLADARLRYAEEVAQALRQYNKERIQIKAFLNDAALPCPKPPSSFAPMIQASGAMLG